MKGMETNSALYMATVQIYRISLAKIKLKLASDSSFTYFENINKTNNTKSLYTNSVSNEH